MKAKLFLILFIVTCWSWALAENQVSSLPSETVIKYELNLFWIPESHEWFFSVGKIGYKSIESLREGLSKLPPGSVVEWNPGCKRIGNEPLLSSEQDLKQFIDELARKNIRVVMIPSG